MRIIDTRIFNTVTEISSITRPDKFKLAEIEGRIVYTRQPAAIYKQTRQDERLVTVPELMKLRYSVFELLRERFPEIDKIANRVYDSKNSDIAIVSALVLETILENPETFSIWQQRLTTSTTMVRTDDKRGNDAVFFYHGNPFETTEELIAAFQGELSDGGIKYSSAALERIVRETPELGSKIYYADYLESRGGNFNGYDLAEHLLLQTGCECDDQLLQKYILALTVLDFLTGWYNRGYMSAWRPGEMKKGYGRPIALGFKGDTFYPPNNSTVDHAALIVSKDTKI